MPAKLRLTSLPQKPAAFIEPMECLAVSKLPDAANWIWEVKIDGYRAIAVKSDDGVNLFSRTKKTFNSKFSYIRDALADLEGIVGKRKDSRYEAGKRSGSWIKHRVNRGQELVIGGYLPGTHGLDSIIVGYYRGKDLIYVASVRNGFVPASRRHLFEKLRPLVISECPFVNLPERHRSRWGEGLTTDDMKKCVWLQPELVAQIDFLEWTDSDHLRHSKFVGLREDKDAREVIKENAGGT